MLGYAPISYVIPHFPATVRFIRPDGNLLLQGDDRFLQTITQVVNDLRTSDKLFVLFHVEDIANRNLEIGASKLGFDPARWKCYSLQTSLGDQLRLCQVNP
jgi:hypothetical protein